MKCNDKSNQLYEINISMTYQVFSQNKLKGILFSIGVSQARDITLLQC